MYETYLHEYRHYDQSIRAFSSFCIICIQLVIVVDQLNLEHTERVNVESYWNKIIKLHFWPDNLNGMIRRHKADIQSEYKIVETVEL